MRRNRTPPAMPATSTSAGLEPVQTVVLEGLLAGKSITEAAQRAGVNRTTVHRWLRQDYRFQAEMNGARLALRDAALTRIDALAEQALEVLQHSLTTGADARIAIEILKGAGLLGGDRCIKSTNAELLERETQSELEARLADFKEKSLFGRLSFGI